MLWRYCSPQTDLNRFFAGNKAFAWSQRLYLIKRNTKRRGEGGVGKGVLNEEIFNGQKNGICCQAPKLVQFEVKVARPLRLCQYASPGLNLPQRIITILGWLLQGLFPCKYTVPILFWHEAVWPSLKRILGSLQTACENLRILGSPTA